MTADVLVLRALGLGDAVTAVPALRGIRRAWPEHRLVLAGPPDVGRWLEHGGLVDEIITATDLKAPLTRPDGTGFSGHVAVNLHGSGPQSHRALLATRPAILVAFARPDLGVAGPGWDADEHEVDRWCRLAASAGGDCEREDLRLELPGPRRGHVVVHPGAASASRRWPTERFAAVVEHLVASGRLVVVTGTAAERPKTAQLVAAPGVAQAPRAQGPGAWDSAGMLDLPALAEMVATADLTISADTGVAHLATAYGTPSVVLFGPTPPRLWGPAIDPFLHTVLWHGADVAQDSGEHRGDAHAPDLDPALAMVTVDEVITAATQLLAAEGRPTSRDRDDAPAS